MSYKYVCKVRQVGLFLAMRWMLISTITISDEITQDTDFYYIKLSSYPSKLATIEYHISYKPAFLPKYTGCEFPVFDIYTEDGHENLKSHCSHNVFGQLRNHNLNFGLRLRKSPFVTCKRDAENGETFNCHSKTIVQDFIPRNYGFSIGCRCGRPAQVAPVQGLAYNISIYDQSNKTECRSRSIPIHRSIMEQNHFTKYCANLYSLMSLPNLIGDQNWKQSLRWTEAFLLIESVSFGLLAKDLKKCYKYFSEFMCHVVVPKCDPDTEQVIHPCKETCYEIGEACFKNILLILRQLNTSNEALLMNWTRIGSSSRELLNCDYLPSNGGPIPCFHKQVTCQSPPNVSNTKVSLANSTYTAKSEVKYMCQSGIFQMEGNNTSTCLYSGQWSELPKCNPRKMTSDIHPFVIVLPLFIIPFIIVMATVTISYCKRKQVQSLTR